MADDTEALKHNFFLRGFFHRSGYYNLANLSPDTYRKNHVFSDPAVREHGCLQQNSS
jgi:phospholipid/cholesterol/gamma-HCH transport system substrate-binding protein